ncbi:hypothetical protein GCM10029964_017680 [Kibdelosporangium lantanae]
MLVVVGQHRRSRRHTRDLHRHLFDAGERAAHAVRVGQRETGVRGERDRPDAVAAADLGAHHGDDLSAEVRFHLSADSHSSRPVPMRSVHTDGDPK